MSLELGQSHKGDAQMTETRVAAEALSSGDAVALDANDELVTADGTNDPTVYGIVGHYPDGVAAGDRVLVTYQGPVIANVAGGTAGGTEVGSSATEGELAAGGSAKGIMTKYAEGAAPGDIPSIPAGSAYVDV
jgi:hypothetical protein